VVKIEFVCAEKISSVRAITVSIRDKNKGKKSESLVNMQPANNKKKKSVIVYFSYFWPDTLGRPPTSFPTSQTLCKCPCFSLLLCFKVASMSSITKGMLFTIYCNMIFE
jgi:hypothetical protein